MRNIHLSYLFDITSLLAIDSNSILQERNGLSNFGFIRSVWFGGIVKWHRCVLSDITSTYLIGGIRTTAMERDT